MQTESRNQSTYYGNLVITDEGGIYDVHNNPVKIKNGKITVMTNERKRTVLAARIIYEVVNKAALPYGVVIRFLDGNENNPAYRNIMVIERKDYFAMHDWDKTKKLPKKTREKIVKEYNREERKKHEFKGQWAHPSLYELSRKYNCSLSTVQKIVNGAY